MPTVAGHMNTMRVAGLLIFCLPAVASAQVGSWEFELEGGPTWQSYNDVEIPNDGSATRFSLYDLAGAGPWPSGRVYVTWNAAERHQLRLLLAPFSLTESGTTSGTLDFAGESYAAAAPLEARYAFNSYRISYRWRFYEGDRSMAWIGFTAKVRDATIALEQAGASSRKDDLGVVPLVHLAWKRRFASAWMLDLDADGLGGGPGRAIDASVKLGREVGAGWSLHAGYRTVEGGADVPEVYSFAWLHYMVFSVRFRP